MWYEGSTCMGVFTQGCICLFKVLFIVKYIHTHANIYLLGEIVTGNDRQESIL